MSSLFHNLQEVKVLNNRLLSISHTFCVAIVQYSLSFRESLERNSFFMFIIFAWVQIVFKHFCYWFLFTVPLTHDTFNKWRNDFYKCEKNVLAQNVCSRIDPFEAALSRKVLETTQHVYTYKVESEGKPLTNQKNSGRCWLFAALNSIRIPFMKNVSKNIEKLKLYFTN